MSDGGGSGGTSGDSSNRPDGGPNAKSGASGKASGARERVRAQQRQQAAAARRRKQLIIAGTAAGVIIIAVGVGLLVQNNTSNSNKAARNAYGANQPFAAPHGVSANPATTTDPGGILYGANLSAPVTLQIWEDVRCPVCKIYEDWFADITRQYADAGKIKVEYRMVDLIDGNLGGQGSLVGGSALGCAQDVSSADFMAFHNLLFKNQPDEKTDSYGSTTSVLNLAGQVQGLRGAPFDACVTDGKYAQWVRSNFEAMKAKAAATGAQLGTPAYYLDGVQFTALNVNDAAQQQANYKAVLDAEIAKKG
jgi:protein-disulfide isomerase